MDRRRPSRTVAPSSARMRLMGLPSHTSEPNAVVLKSTVSGKIVLDLLLSCFSGRIECDIEPTSETVGMLVDFVREIESLMPDPLSVEKHLADPPLLSDRIKKYLELSNCLCELDKRGIGVFIGAYVARAKRPRFAHEESYFYTKDNQPFEPVAVCRIRIASKASPNIVVIVDDIWETRRYADDDVPF